ncbi:MAG: hypothetical protein H6736_17095 [Alphaproteobacteria bacterium]|nr:hypothetical protein [Alphaproteobacteria bacterium]MCB9693531.1 hypothetical protein [Alphaproteobacteria bacterium]
MRRRAPLQQLRGSDPTLLEVQLPDLLIRPSSQLEPPNLCDLFALSELESCPKSVKLRLQNFIDRAKAEMSEISEGSDMATFVREIDAVDPERVPASFRAFLGQLVGRPGRDSTGLKGLLEKLEGHEPEAFTLGAPKIRMQRAEAASPEKSTVRTRRSTGDARKTATRTSAPAKPARQQTVVDIDKMNWIRDTLIERLATASDSGLGEHVLIAGIKHRAQSVYPRLGPHEITAVLNDMLKKGLVRKSAGRWSRS